MKELNLRAERLKNKWTLEYVSQNLGVSNQAVSKLETGQSKPSYDVLCAMEKLFNKPHDYLLAVNNHATPISN